MKQIFFIVAAAIMCLLSSCSEYTAHKTLYVSLSEPSDIYYIVSYKGKDLTIAEQKITKEKMLDIAKRNLSANEAKKEIQQVFTKEFNRSAISLSYVSKSEQHDGHSSFCVSYNWTLLQWGVGAIMVIILLNIARNMIKRRLRNQRFKRLPNELDAGD